MVVSHLIYDVILCLKETLFDIKTDPLWLKVKWSHNKFNVHPVHILLSLFFVCEPVCFSTACGASLTLVTMNLISSECLDSGIHFPFLSR